MNKKLLLASSFIIGCFIMALSSMASVTYAVELENTVHEMDIIDDENESLEQEDENETPSESSGNEEVKIKDSLQSHEAVPDIKSLKVFNKRGIVMKTGDQGESVKSLHTLLKWLNYPVDETSIIFNAQTEAAVSQFQEDHSMKRTGIVDKLTYIRLNDYLHHRRMVYDYTDFDVKMGPTEDYWIIINKTTNVLQLYKGKNPLRVYPIATGRYPSFTPEGWFTISNKLAHRKAEPSWDCGFNGILKRNIIGHNSHQSFVDRYT